MYCGWMLESDRNILHVFVHVTRCSIVSSSCSRTIETTDGEVFGELDKRSPFTEN